MDAIFNAIRTLYPHTATLELFQVGAVTAGTDAQATVSVRLAEDGRTVTGKGSDTDTLVAAAYDYVNALNKLLVKRQKHAPEAQRAKMTKYRPWFHERRRPARGARGV